MDQTANSKNQNSEPTGFGRLPDEAFIRQSQLIPDPIPFSSATLWRKVGDGTFPPPVKLSERVTAWKVGDIRAWIRAREASHRV